jgi:hypothetical protein
MPTSNSIDWQIESIRVTAFVNGQLNPGMLETWIEEVSENSPSQISKAPSSFIGVSRSTAGFLRTNWNANRLDVTLSSEQPQSSQTIAPISEATSLFSRFVDRIPEIGELAPVDRLALGLILTFQVPFTKKELESILYRIYDSVATRQVVQSATSPTPPISLPPSGTGVQAAIPVEVPKQAVGKTPIPDLMPRPSSSTTSE